jgi:hypothetical protein
MQPLRDAKSEFAEGLIQAAIVHGKALAARRFRPIALRNSCRWFFRCGAAIGIIVEFVSCTPPTWQTTALKPIANSRGNQAIDAEDVAMLLTPAPGSRFRLGKDNPNSARNFRIERQTPAIARNDGALQYWNVAAHDLDYATGGSGKTSRLHIYASGGRQSYTWKTQHGFLSSSADIRNQEFTAFVRVHGITDPKRAAISLKIRGGAHGAIDPDLASCTMMTFQSVGTGAVTRFGKELTHPIYDYVKLTPALDAALIENRWFGLKLLSYSSPGVPTRVVNRLYLDDDPIEPATGKPRNNWKLMSEFVDAEGVTAGKYAKLADWGGWQTTLRTDGVSSLDFTMISLREVLPGQ